MLFRSAFIRQRVGPTESIAPEERVSSSEALNALADVMFYIIKSGAKSLGEAVNKARQLLGPNATQFKDADYKQAYEAASARVHAQERAAQPRPTTEQTSVAPDASLEARMDAQLAAAGGKMNEAVKSAPFESLRDDPKNYVNEKYKGFGNFLSNVETRWFSSDAKLKIGRASCRERV